MAAIWAIYGSHFLTANEFFPAESVKQRETYDEVLRQSASQGLSRILQVSSGEMVPVVHILPSAEGWSGQRPGTKAPEETWDVHWDWQNLIIVCFATQSENWFYVADVSQKSGWRGAVI